MHNFNSCHLAHNSEHRCVMINRSAPPHFERATVKTEIDRRLRRWGFYQLIANDPGLMPHKNLLADLIKKRMDGGVDRETVAPVDWSQEEEVDKAVQILTLLYPVPSACLYARYVYGGPRIKLADAIDIVMRQLRAVDLKAKRISDRRYWTALDQGKVFVSGRLSLGLSIIDMTDRFNHRPKTEF